MSQACGLSVPRPDALGGSLEGDEKKKKQTTITRAPLYPSAPFHFSLHWGIICPRGAHLLGCQLQEAESSRGAGPVGGPGGPRKVQGRHALNGAPQGKLPFPVGPSTSCLISHRSPSLDFGGREGKLPKQEPRCCPNEDKRMPGGEEERDHFNWNTFCIFLFFLFLSPGLGS